MATMKKVIKKAQNGTLKLPNNVKEQDSINQAKSENRTPKLNVEKLSTLANSEKQLEKKSVAKLAKKKMKNGGSLTGLKASTKRDKGIDPKGAWTKVQNKTLAGAKGKAKLTPDKELGATKMTAKRGMKISKKK